MPIDVRTVGGCVDGLSSGGSGGQQIAVLLAVIVERGTRAVGGLGVVKIAGILLEVLINRYGKFQYGARGKVHVRRTVKLKCIPLGTEGDVQGGTCTYRWKHHYSLDSLGIQLGGGAKVPVDRCLVTGTQGKV